LAGVNCARAPFFHPDANWQDTMIFQFGFGNYWRTPGAILYLNLFNDIPKISCRQMSDIAEDNMADQLPTCHVSYPAQFSSDIGTLDDLRVTRLTIGDLFTEMNLAPADPNQSSCDKDKKATHGYSL
jgi:hypothetical protein